MNKVKNINVRNFRGSSVPVGSKIGKILINSKESDKIAKAVRVTVRGGRETVKISKSTADNIKSAKINH